MCGSVSSTGNDLGVWSFERDGCWACISVHLHHFQLAPGTPLPVYVIFSQMLHIMSPLTIRKNSKRKRGKRSFGLITVCLTYRRVELFPVVLVDSFLTYLPVSPI